MLSLKLGRVDVRFQEPWSLREFINEQRARLEQPPTSSAKGLGEDLGRRLLQTLGYKVLSDVNAVSVVMPGALVGTVLLTLRGRGVGKAELVRRVDWLSDRVRAQGGKVAHFASSSTEEVVNRALEVLGPKLVGRVEGLPEETFYAVDRIQLSFYRNMAIHLFISEAMICAAVYTKVKAGGAAEEQRISYSEMHDYVYFLSQLFRAEFIFSTTPLDENIQTALQGLERDRVLRRTQKNALSREVDNVELHPSERASGRENFDFYLFLLWPFVEASWLGAVSLFMLIPPSNHSDRDISFDFKAFQDKAQLLGKTLYHQGDLSYYEAVNRDALRNAFTRAEEARIIFVTRSKDARVPSTVRLVEGWKPTRDESGRLKAEGRLWDFCERISHGRREGKNRRDGATVRTRVLSLIKLVSADLFESAVFGADSLPRKSQRRTGIEMKAHL